MPVVSNTDANRIRNARKVETHPVLNIVPLQAVASADIASNAVYPATQYTVSNTVTWNNCDVGRAYAVISADGTLIKTWGVQRKPSNFVTFFPDVKSDGDGGFARTIHYPIVAGDRVVVYRHRPAWGLISQTTNEGQLKQWDIPYTGQGSAPDPVIVMGTHQQAFVDADGYAVFTFDSSLSFDWTYAQAGIIGRQWYVPTEAEYLSGSPTSPQITIRLPKGTYEIGLDVVSQNGRVTRGYRWVFANSHDPEDADAPFSYKAVVEGIADTRNALGREMTFTIKALPAALREQLYPGAMCVFTDRTLFDGDELADDVTVKTFVGYLDDTSFEQIRDSGTVTLKFSGPLRASRSIPTATQLIQTVASPAGWTDVQFAYSHPAFAAWYILKHHTGLLANHDFGLQQVDIVLLRRLAYGFRANQISGQLQSVAEMFVGEVNARSDGTITLTFEPNHLENDARNAIDTKFTWTANDIRAPLRLAPRLKPQVGQTIMDGASWDGVNQPLSYRAIAPGYASSQGIGQSDETDIMVLPTDSQERLERIVGHRFAFINNPLETLEARLVGMADICEPADADWHIIDVPESYLAFNPVRFGINWALIRVRPSQVNCGWQKVRNVWIKTLNISFRAETFGRKGAFLPVGRGEGASYINPYTGWIAPINTIYRPYVPPYNGINPEIATVFAWNDQGLCGLTETFLSAVVEWEDPTNPNSATQRLRGRLLHAEWTRYASDPAVLAITLDGNQIKVWSCPDIRVKPPLWNLQFAETINLAGFSGWARVDTATSVNFRAAAWAMADGVYVRRGDGSVSWSAAVKVGGPYGDLNIGASRLGMVIQPGTQDLYISGLTADATYGLFKATGRTGAFSLVANQPAGSSSELHSLLKFDSTNKLWVSLFQNENLGGSGSYATTVKVYQEDYPTDSSVANPPGTTPITTMYGFRRREETLEQNTNENIVYRATRVVARFRTRYVYAINYPGGPPPPVESNYYPPPLDPIGPTMIASIRLLDPGLNVIWGSPEKQWGAYTKDASAYLIEAINSLGFGDTYYYRFTSRYDMDITLPAPAENVAWVEVTFKTAAPTRQGVNVNFIGTVIPQFELLFDQLSVFTSDKFRRGRRLFVKSTSDVWTDVTPDREYGVGRHPESLALYSSGLSAVMIPTGVEDNKRRIIRSSNGGADWLLGRSSSPYAWLKRLDTDIYIVGGDGKLDLSTDGLKTAEPRIGNWAQTRGSIGRMEGALVLIET